MLHLLVTWLYCSITGKDISAEIAHKGDYLGLEIAPANLVAVLASCIAHLALTCSLAFRRGYARSPGDGLTISLDDARPAFAIEGSPLQ